MKIVKCDDEGFSKAAIIAAVVAPLLLLSPLLYWLCRKWMAYNALRAQYDVLKSSVPTNGGEFPSTALEMDADENAIETPRSTLDNEKEDVGLAGAMPMAASV